MAKNNSYKKIVAGTMTAAMVAGVVTPAAAAGKTFPDVPAWAADSVNYLVEKGAINGKPDGTFAPTENIDRASAAKIMAITLGLEIDKEAKPSFKDAQDNWATPYIAAVEKAGVIVGDGSGLFNPNDQITRASMASMLVKAYELEAPNAETKFADLKDHWGAKYANVLVALGISNGTDNGWAPDKAVTRAEAAQFIAKTDAKYAPAKEAKIASVTATSTTTLELKGEGLQTLKAEDLSVEGNKVASITPSISGKTVKVTLEGKLAPNKEYTLKANIKGETKEFKFAYAYKVETVAVNNTTVDNDTKGQKVTINVNGAAADLDALKAAGYTVEFLALDADNNKADVFEDTTTGELKANLDAFNDKNLKVQVTVTKGSTVITSELGTLKVRNLEAVTTAINSYELTNSAIAGKQNSTTLVVGETAFFNKLEVTSAGEKLTIGDKDATATPDKVKVESSNPAVISVKEGQLTANTPGTATVTLTYGDVKKNVTFTVKNDERKVAKVTTAKNSVKVIKGNTETVEVTAYDQYGDLANGKTFNVNLPKQVTGAATATTDQEGKATVTVTGAEVGNGTVYIKDKKKNVLGSFNVNVTEVNNVGSKKLEIVKDENDDTQSADATLDINNDNKVIYELKKYTTENVSNGTESLSGYTVKYNADIVTIGARAEGEQSQEITADKLEITAKKAGSTDVAVYDQSGKFVTKVKITVVKEEVKITDVKFKSVPTINYIGKTISATEVFDMTDVADDKDRIVKGITLSKPNAHPVRVENSGVVYIDKDGNGHKDDKEVVLGSIQGAVTSDSENLTFGATIFDGATTAEESKGTVIFKVLDNNNKIIKSTSVKVDVK
ncbi:S-layer homology domain-containing protein [Bacillus cytotoxicus]|uniref:S-layer homology domain-containing protein n=1 Tax=Bacillus cereus group sp. BfR-BA-01492 TaxID=2920361 RepID=UPI001F575963|nr:S-layer homology domain-containing protein [Bacillus cereus group sp. BfR-BA-01492]EMA6344728.1 S-layer homology domain-containing protein [Bacillus cytotoxicus]